MTPKGYFDRPVGANIPEFILNHVAQVRPQNPLYLTSEQGLVDTARIFTSEFKGDTLYAVKANPDKTVIQTLYKSGVRSFDVASLEEVKRVKRYAPKAKLYFMHPIKSPEAIKAAYFGFGVRTFVIDTTEELYKIIRETGMAQDLEIFIRLGLPKNETATIDFAAKFGASPELTAQLLKMARPMVKSLGVSFHVGTQTLDPSVYTRAIDCAASVIKSSGVKVDSLDVGGGFPVTYPGQVPPPLSTYFQAIELGMDKNDLQDLTLLAEPGRYLVAESTWLCVRVEQRRDDILYLNDGTYGGLFDAGPVLKGRFPVAYVSQDEYSTAEVLKPFRFAGPTCDSLDMMNGPFMLPENIRTGDWIVVGNMGAYSQALRSNFNGFGRNGAFWFVRSKFKKDTDVAL